MNHNSIAPLRSIPRIRRTLSAIAIVFSVGLALAALGSPATTAWTYQGQLQRSGAAYNGICNFQFTLWDALSGGTQKGITQSINSVSVANGLFTVALGDFRENGSGGYPGFTGDALWLGTSVQCSGDGGFTSLDPRQPITPTPYAVTLAPGASIIGPGLGTPIGLAGTLNVYNTATQGYGVYGASAGDPDSAGVFGTNTDGAGIRGRSSGSGPGIYGENTGAGLAGRFEGPVTVKGMLGVDLSFQATGNAISGFGGDVGVYGQGYFGVQGFTENPNGAGVQGQASSSASGAPGVLGVSNGSGPAVLGKNFGSGSAIYGQSLGSGYAGRFTGTVVVEGNLVVTGGVVKGGGSFRIDHPLDPANKFLSHSFVESPDMMNFYNGNVTTDASGSATVTLPDYFAALNRDYRYQLTVLGQFAQAIVSRKIAGNRFEIGTDKPGVEVSWQVTGIRQDAYAQANPIVVEEAKPAEEQGLYLFPAGFGAGEEKQIGYPSRPTAPRAQEPPVTGPDDQARRK
jgi:hypothetical protein